ncbi:7-carboxy-7-deazaguanine synthase [Gracilariopsis chorda]|uniref:7-carboxy-7-deazaguanine synthase n=1 Tax=Gracilariopsis chorda TaxID=448386 RepID=A0A2V3J6X3_9FLOR|nr:7-carboxy-7-deazaguanine synthase [Gracilariopsis chorda]|eukprot:PXF50176.1 7-carboxy-7-deazaguanine synthase [Gracilariopsis chorda]
MFRSVQGEGPNTGRPSVFLRLGVCNLSCAWCDTPYTWLFSQDKLNEVNKRAAEHGKSTPFNTTFKKHDELRRLPVADAFDELTNLADGVKAIVITGGEPLLHKKPLLHLLPRFIREGYEIEFETNGTVSPDGLPAAVHLNVSPKLSNSLMRNETRLNFQVLQQCMRFRSSVLKFVVDGPSDLDEINDIVQKLGVHPNRVYLMPQGTNSETIRKRGRWLVDVCIEHGFQYTHRVHVELWGDKRGV